MYEGAIQDLIDALGRLPGIGPKSAQRIAFHILQSENETAHALVDAIRTVKERVKFCVQCGNVSEETECRICRDPRRDPTQICVVEESKDVIAIERTREFRVKMSLQSNARGNSAASITFSAAQSAQSMASVQNNYVFAN